jgi:hypothetical protein
VVFLALTVIIALGMIALRVQAGGAGHGAHGSGAAEAGPAGSL